MSINFINSKTKRVGVHMFFWIVSLCFFWLLFSRNNQNGLNTAVFIAVLSPIAITITYYFNYYLIPNFLMAGGYFKFVWYGAIVSIVGLWLSSMGGIMIWIWLADYNIGKVSYASIDVPMLIAALFFVVLMGVSIKLFRISLQTRYVQEKAEREKLAIDNQLKLSELKLLKDQLNPHFLFNTLNNIYGLTLEKSEKAPDLVMRLSEILDYMLYQTSDEKVSLVDELEMVKNYVNIEGQRFEGRYPVVISVNGTPENITIAPLIFLPIIENCFKHGIRKTIDTSGITIQFEILESLIVLKTKNQFSEERLKSGGIGLTNLRKRLQLIYPNKHHLTINKNDGKFETELKIEI